MKITESVLREKISRILNEQLKYTSLRGRDLEADASEKSLAGGGKKFVLNDPVASGFLHSITSEGSILGYISWKIVFEEILHRNFDDAQDLNKDKRNNVFSDVEISGVNYSVKSTLRGGHATTKAVSGSPSFTPSFVNRAGDTKKYGIIAGYKAGNVLNWVKVGQIRTGEQLKASLEILKQKIASVPNESVDKEATVAKNIVGSFKSGKNPNYLINYFFNPQFKSDGKQIINDRRRLKGVPFLSVDLGPEIPRKIDAYPEKAEQIDYINQSIGSLSKEDIEEIVKYIVDAIKVRPISYTAPESSGAGNKMFP